MTRRIRTGLVSSLGLLILILDAQTAVSGAAEGIDLCLRTVIPSLLPFFVLSILLTGSLTGVNIPILRPIGRLCGIPKGGEALLLVGFLGGYPAGAQAVAQAFQARQLTRQSAKRMLAFCSNAGPAFLFGMVAGKFTQSWVPWALWAVHILSALTVGALLPGKDNSSIRLGCGKEITMSDALRRSVTIMASVCGWVIVFRVIIAFLSRWCLWLLPASAQVTVNGILELSNGCCDLGRIPNDGLRFIICSAVLAFGGLCVAMQTDSVTGSLGMGWYLPGKVVQSLISVFLAAIGHYFLFPAENQTEISPWLLVCIALTVAIYAVISRRIEKKGSNPVPIGV